MPNADEASSIDRRKLKNMEIAILQAEKLNSQTREKTITSIADRTY